MRTSHHRSMGNAEDVVDEVRCSCRITCFRTVGGLTSRHVGANVPRDSQCLNAKIGKTSCDQGVPPVQVVVLLIGTMMLVG